MSFGMGTITMNFKVELCITFYVLVSPRIFLPFHLSLIEKRAYYLS